jgi:hypothetical protein
MEGLHRWAREQATEDSRNGFSLIDNVTSQVGSSFKTFAANVPESERPAMARSLVDAWFAACGMQDVNPANSQWPNAWLTYRRNLPPEGGSVRNPDHALELWAKVEPALTPVIGERTHQRGGTFIHSLPVGAYNITTEIEIGSRSGLFGYFHTVKEGRRAVLTNVNLLAWRGLLGSTDWDSLRGKSVSEVAGGIVRVVRLFLDAAPTIAHT